jgi:hypothetical protein
LSLFDYLYSGWSALLVWSAIFGSGGTVALFRVLTARRTGSIRAGLGGMFKIDRGNESVRFARAVSRRAVTSAALYAIAITLAITWLAHRISS